MNLEQQQQQQQSNKNILEQIDTKILATKDSTIIISYLQH